MSRDEADALEVAKAERRAETAHAAVILGISTRPETAELLSFSTMYRRVALDALTAGKPVAESVATCANGWAKRHRVARRALDAISFAGAPSTGDERSG